ncbi:MAG: thiamine phosphate synthase [Desulfobacca sp.]|uniref:thiamine phosphate synthase n=1 Tax=Desulfobacca sp. TaxID=2067990 RepID=UPI004049BB04
MKGYYFITDAHLSRAGNRSDVQAAVAAGVLVVQYREKDADTASLLAEARELRRLCHGTLFLLNDYVEVALEVGADGVHLGQEDMPLPEARRLLGPGKIIGVTVNTVAQALRAAQQGADYLGVSPIFATRTKPDAGEPAGLSLLREIRRLVSLPLIAIGGITLDNAPAVIAAGADGICAISAVVTQPEVGAAIRQFQRLFGP